MIATRSCAWSSVVPIRTPPEKRNDQFVPASKWLRLLMSYIPDKYQHRVRYFGYYRRLYDAAAAALRTGTSTPKSAPRASLATWPTIRPTHQSRRCSSASAHRRHGARRSSASTSTLPRLCRNPELLQESGAAHRWHAAKIRALKIAEVAIALACGRL